MSAPRKLKIDRRDFPRMSEVADEKGYILPARLSAKHLTEMKAAEKQLQAAFEAVMKVLLPLILPEGGKQ